MFQHLSHSQSVSLSLLIYNSSLFAIQIFSPIWYSTVQYSLVDAIIFFPCESTRDEQRMEMIVCRYTAAIWAHAVCVYVYMMMNIIHASQIKGASYTELPTTQSALCLFLFALCNITYSVRLCRCCHTSALWFKVEKLWNYFILQYGRVTYPHLKRIFNSIENVQKFQSSESFTDQMRAEWNVLDGCWCLAATQNWLTGQISVKLGDLILPDSTY